ncbi:hypothetical protein U3516DRAFT_748112 [Neocallimastix sp. 'constans']
MSVINNFKLRYNIKTAESEINYELDIRTYRLSLSDNKTKKIHRSIFLKINDVIEEKLMDCFKHSQSPKYSASVVDVATILFVIRVYNVLLRLRYVRLLDFKKKKFDFCVDPLKLKSMYLEKLIGLSSTFNHKVNTTPAIMVFKFKGDYFQMIITPLIFKKCNLNSSSSSYKEDIRKDFLSFKDYDELRSPYLIVISNLKRVKFTSYGPNFV